MPEFTSHLFEELSAIATYIGAARSILKDGLMPDMTPLEKRITDVCLAIQAADSAEQGQCLPQLAMILKNLDECERDIRAWNEAQKKADKP